MRKYLIFLFASFFVMMSITCQKRNGSMVEEADDSEEAILTYIHTDRNDVPPPPDTPWWTLDTNNLDNCQERLWGYLKTMYPNRESDYWDYEIYSIMDEPGDIWENRAFIEQYLTFFYRQNSYLRDEREPCRNVDTTFFLQALGEPTCKSHIESWNEVIFFYQFKMRYRRGPCPYIFDENTELEFFCNLFHLEYCASMKASFRLDTGKLHYIDFFGPGGG